MNLYDVYPMKKGTLVIVNGYYGESDFYLLHDVIKEIIQPDDSGYSVDSMCIGGYVKKDGILLNTSSESPYDYCSFWYEPAKMSEEDVKRVEGWIDAVVKELHKRKEPAERSEDDEI